MVHINVAVDNVVAQVAAGRLPAADPGAVVTTNPGVFAGGDIGLSTVVKPIPDATERCPRCKRMSRFLLPALDGTGESVCGDCYDKVREQRKTARQTAPKPRQQTAARKPHREPYIVQWRENRAKRITEALARIVWMKVQSRLDRRFRPSPFLFQRDDLETLLLSGKWPAPEPPTPKPPKLELVKSAPILAPMVLDRSKLSAWGQDFYTAHNAKPGSLQLEALIRRGTRHLYHQPEAWELAA